MRKHFLIFAVFLYVSSALAAGHITKAQKEKTIECLGHYSATAVLPAETIEVKNMELALASVKVIREYLTSEGVKDDEMNKGMNVYVDKVYGKLSINFVHINIHTFVHLIILNAFRCEVFSNYLY